MDTHIANTDSRFAVASLEYQPMVSTLVVKTPNQYWGFSAKDGTSVWNLTLNYPVTQTRKWLYMA